MSVMDEVYGPGGYDPDHPTGNVIERVENRGDGTGTRTTFDADGNVVAVEELSDLPPPPSGDPDAAKHEDIAALRAEVTALRSALVAAQVIDDSAITDTIETAKEREIALAKLSAASELSREELVKIEASDPDRWAEIVAKFGIDVPPVKGPKG